LAVPAPGRRLLVFRTLRIFIDCSGPKWLSGAFSSTQVAPLSDHLGRGHTTCINRCGGLLGAVDGRDESVARRLVSSLWLLSCAYVNPAAIVRLPSMDVRCRDGADHSIGTAAPS
jgi:hypothetical protein